MSTRILMRTAAFLGPALILTAVCSAQMANVTVDSRLKSPISIRMKIEQLPAALKQLSKLCGVQLQNVQTANDLKVTVFVRDVPAGVVLDKIAKVLGLEWKADGDLLRLVIDPDERIRRDRFIDAEDSANRKDIEAQLNKLASLANFDPSAPGGNIADPNHPDAQQQDLLKLAANPQNLVAGRFLANLDGPKVGAFWQGQIVAGGSGPVLEPQPNPGSGAVSQYSRTRQRAQRRPPTGTPIFAQFDPLLYSAQIAARGAVTNIPNRPPSLISNYTLSPQLAAMPFGKEVLAWDQPVPSDGDLARVTLKGGESRSPNANHLLAAYDYLEMAFDQTGVPFVADGFRVPTFGKDLNRNVGPFTAWLNGLKKENHLATRFEDGVVMVRHDGFWRLRKFETPEETLAPLEKKVAKEKLTIDDYAAFAAKLTPEQTRPFSIPNGYVTVFDSHPLEAALPALQFYASLDSGAVSRSSRGGIAFDQLGASQRQLGEYAALEGVFLGTASGGFTLDLVRLCDSGDTRGLGFLLKSDTVPQRGLQVDAQAMLFGINLNQATTYKIPISQ